MCILGYNNLHYFNLCWVTLTNTEGVSKLRFGELWDWRFRRLLAGLSSALRDRLLTRGDALGVKFLRLTSPTDVLTLVRSTFNVASDCRREMDCRGKVVSLKLRPGEVIIFPCLKSSSVNSSTAWNCVSTGYEDFRCWGYIVFRRDNSLILEFESPTKHLPSFRSRRFVLKKTRNIT